MAEISKAFKILLLGIAIVSLYYATMYLFLTDFYYAGFGPLHPYYDPWATRVTGVTMLCFFIFGIWAIKVADWEKIRLYTLFGIGWLIISMIEGNFVWFDTEVKVSPGVITNRILNLTVGIVFIVLLLYFYLQEEKKLK
ncbi:MAG: hypothetical protein HWN65_23290 [Candidatus Helarchaeota archaeon]|nr:hypothetical protein [Candidatus Helarchaeota archaeon]